MTELLATSSQQQQQQQQQQQYRLQVGLETDIGGGNEID
jgi:hypothetical protein